MSAAIAQSASTQILSSAGRLAVLGIPGPFLCRHFSLAALFLRSTPNGVRFGSHFASKLGLPLGLDQFGETDRWPKGRIALSGSFMAAGVVPERMSLRRMRSPSERMEQIDRMVAGASLDDRLGRSNRSPGGLLRVHVR